ncbi:hypothetical protein C5F48_10715 [Cereibacter changlensis JA139]|uniref:Uncharacterized protein n=2 Tax=Cereibacter changlensis TaxID=402884 RepID=A0A2T4JUZ4_9RHOB|nr:hypothetical protein [Cereibacter changlensis]PTE21738.1 hypothetical protein C5F48_10715 [Cereibacter changlensis JA139]PZX50309.1 hypothetical protein LX76_03456 [Cereibacter changlensis]
MTPVNIQVFVDVIALLSGASPAQAVHLFDDSSAGSEALGTTGLVSSVLPGQLVRWTVTPLDVQTQVWIRGIAFGAAPPDAPPSAADDPPVWSRRFEGYVPADIFPGAPHPYRLDLCFGAANGPIVAVEGPALRLVPPCADMVAGDGASRLL